MESYNKTGKPRIFAYVRVQGSAVSGQLDTGESREESGELGDGGTSQGTGKGLPLSINSTLNTPISTLFSARPYSHLDTLKLGILMQIKQLGLDGVDIRLADGKAWQGGDALMALDDVETVAGYENLQNLKHSREELESKYIEAKARYAENPDDEAAYEAFSGAAKLRGEAMEEIRNVELQLYHMIEGMYEQTAKGKLSKRQNEAYRLSDRGLIGEARDVLDFYSIVEESRHREEVAERYANDAQINVNELIQLKDLNAALLDWESVVECYKEAARLEEKHNLPRKATLEYISYLSDQYMYKEALEQALTLSHYYENANTSAPDREKVLFLTTLGRIYTQLTQVPEAEEALNTVLKLLYSMDDDKDYIDRYIGIIHHMLGYLFDNSLRYEEAVKSFEASLEKRIALAARFSGDDEELLATTYVNIGATYNNMGKYEASVENSLIAREKLLKLTIGGSDPNYKGLNERNLTVCIFNLCDSYLALERFDEAEEQLGEALDICLKLAGQDPESNEIYLASTYFNYGNLFAKTGRYAQAEEKYGEALKMVKRHVAHSPDFFEPIIAEINAALGGVYAETGRLAEAENGYRAAIKMFGKYAESNPACAENAGKSQKALDDLKAKQLRESPRGPDFPHGARTELTPEERELALLLTEGLTKRDIARKLHIDVDVVAAHEREIRKKLNLMSGSDPVIAAIAAEYNLTRREAETLRCLCSSTSNEDIAAELVLSAETVRIHVRNIIRKLPVEKRENIREWVESYEV